MSEPFSVLRCAVLVDACEDLAGVWVAWWHANGLFPDMAISDRLALAERVVRDLVDADLVSLHRGAWDGTLPSSDGATLVPIQRHDVPAVLKTYDVWVPSDLADPVVLVLTERGEVEADICRDGHSQH
ncbi:hypothetical protein [Blastococcus brunescens]|uniref:Uncharacterized protein n=1 Tax=Blastococcus brunescens TaxID=1564165 RepID=A0ABZ1AXA4_9ACTN|nr:hypothetical protein [Blastococcus sp. BMG 8361]WRL62541.1 hypothetical protein U6N30_21490 [Blastococcus sp. BMG 8361]